MDGGTVSLCRGAQVIQNVQLQHTLAIPTAAQWRAAAHVLSLQRHGQPVGQEMAALAGIIMAAGIRDSTEDVGQPCKMHLWNLSALV